MVSKFKRLKKARRGRPAGSVFKVRDVQARRSIRAKTIDARLKARLAKNVEEWAKQPNRRDLEGVDYPQVKTSTIKKENRAHLQVIWTRNSHLRHKDFPLDKKRQAFNWYWRMNADQIVLREEGKYGHSFSESDVPKFRQEHPTKEGYEKVFTKWLKDGLE